jgi:cysteine-rich repeat protein
MRWRSVFLAVSVPLFVAACSSGDDARCGDGLVDPGEECEPGPAASCTADCRVSQCGDDIVEGAEQCEPALDSNCTSDCRRPQCGDGRVEADEECDPLLNQPYCSSDCRVAGACGDGQITSIETCDDGNTYDGDGCGTFCSNAYDGDGCVTVCIAENGYTCSGQPSQCVFGPPLDGSILLAEMTSQQVLEFCQWSVAALGGEGATVKCSSSATGTARWDGALCVAGFGVDATCQATLGDWLVCSKPMYVSGADVCAERTSAIQCLQGACGGVVP